MSGHSKWANIKHRKGRQDAKRGKLFAKLIKSIESAARNGGSDMSANPTLTTAVQKAKDNSVPKDNIDRAIARGVGDVDGVQYVESFYEGYAPGGVAIYVQILTD
ncbi:MAG: YebC/PmpR family DNA-binding transcriptional regulator, partial [Actinomycetia bacterium]|nr:YebC/PmpR family DNA-binding transcriptional regulator [Actinomycetes bacterium]